MRGKMWPIQSELKAKRIKWVGVQNPISWAYLKELRENNKTKKIYDINTYIEVYQFRNNMYGLFNQNCDGAGDVWQYLIVGPEKAMLIDTAYGLGDMKGLCDEITKGKPLIVVNTHHHFDHAYGNCRFDRVFCHEYLLPYLESQNERMWDYLFDAEGNCIWLEFDRNDLPKFRRYEIVGVPDGHVFNLGGDYDVELVWTAGHTAGHAMYLDKKDRFLFCGDDICSDVTAVGIGPKPGEFYPHYCNIQSYRDTLAKLCTRMDEFDYLFPSHFMVNIENNLLHNVLETLDAILTNPRDCDYEEEHPSPNGGENSVSMHKYIRGFSTVAYTEKGVYRPEPAENGEKDHSIRRR